MVVRDLVTVLRYKLDEAGIKQYEHSAEKAGRSVAKSGKRAMHPWIVGARHARESMNSLAVQVRGLAAAYASFATVKTILETSGEMAKLNRRIKQVTSSSREYLQTQQALLHISNETGSALQENISQYTRLREALPAKKTKQVQQLFRELQLGIRASGSTAEEAEEVINNFIEGLGKGHLETSVIGPLAEFGPVLRTSLIKGLNEVNPKILELAGNLDQAASKGMLTTDIVLKALSTQLDNLKKKSDAMPKSLAFAMTNLRNSFSDMIGQSSTASGALSGVVKVIDFVSKHMKQLVGPGIAVGAGLLARMFGVKALPVTMAVLFGQDVLSWLRGDKSVLGQLIGPVEEHQKAINAIKEALGKIVGYLKWIKNNIFGQKETPFAEWATELVFILLVMTAISKVVGTVVKAAAAGVAAFKVLDKALAGGAAGRLLGKGAKLGGRGLLAGVSRMMAGVVASLNPVVAGLAALFYPSGLSDSTLDHWNKMHPPVGGSGTTVNITNNSGHNTVNQNGVDLSSPEATRSATVTALDLDTLKHVQIPANVEIAP